MKTIGKKRPLCRSVSVVRPFCCSASVTFFKQFHESLACTVKSLLKRSEVSEAIFLSPKRGDSLVKFIEKIKEIGLDYELLENYDTNVWNIHQKLLKGDDSTWANYDADHCYPLLLRMTLPAHEYK
ncbi:hypothetical protein B296_00001966 [Ensete ventricosum]|uniref:Uncharacterized protein n=1 Tax=Ensete ventricosum TaxID=4639 RepID=A0A427B000_ENSVE|nr:hypothetical protein B296_00001966 [Ensete ventricosum]